MVKKLQPQSKYSQFDVDGDGVVTDKEIAMEKEMMELRLEYERELMQMQLEHEAELFRIRISGEKDLFEAQKSLQSQP